MALSEALSEPHSVRDYVHNDERAAGTYGMSAGLSAIQLVAAGMMSAGLSAIQLVAAGMMSRTLQLGRKLGSTERARAPNSRVCVRTATATAPRFPPLIGSGANVGDRQYIEHYVFRFCMFRASGASKAGSMAGSWVCTCACVPLLYRVNRLFSWMCLGPVYPLATSVVARVIARVSRLRAAIPASFAAHSRGRACCACGAARMVVACTSA